MSHESNGISVSTFAFYLPQFYPVPLNDEWWGDGYSEWTAVLNAQRGSRSPVGTTITPGQLGFYDLRLRDTREQQGILASKHGLDAFCVYHYYSRGQRSMPDVVDALLSDGAPETPFFFCWANHDWNLSWKGQPEVVIRKQEYDALDDDAHFDWLSATFSDPRYYRIGAAPVLAIYDPEAIPNSKALFERWRRLSTERGHAGLVILGFATEYPPPSPQKIGIDAWIEGGTARSESPWRRVATSLRSVGGIVRFLRYGDLRIDRARLHRRSGMIRRAAKGAMIPMVMTSWNNVGRRSRRATYMTASPSDFEAELRRAFIDAPTVTGPKGATRLVAINAWNEWGEAMAIEPTREHGDRMLAALKSVVDSVSRGKPER